MSILIMKWKDYPQIENIRCDGWRKGKNNTFIAIARIVLN